MQQYELWTNIQRIYKEQNTKNRLNNITSKMYLRSGDFAKLRNVSAACAKEMPGVLAQLVAENSGHTDHEEHLLHALCASRDMDNIIASSGVFIGLPMVQKLKALYGDFCLHMNTLTVDSIAESKLLYNQTVKMHMIQHDCEPVSYTHLTLPTKA